MSRVEASEACLGAPDPITKSLGDGCSPTTCWKDGRYALVLIFKFLAIAYYLHIVYLIARLYRQLDLKNDRIGVVCEYLIAVSMCSCPLSALCTLFSHFHI